MPPKGRTAKDFDELKERIHIYEIPDMFIGSTDRKSRSEWIFDIDSKKMIQAEVDIPDGVTRVILEIISNAGDNSYFSKYHGVDPGKIDFSWDSEGYLTVRNGGLPIPVEPYKTSTPDALTLVPEKVFSNLRTSTNYDKEKERLGCGRNGFGSKLTNIFSKHFVVEVGDSKRIDESGNEISGQEYLGEWKENMTKLESSVANPGFTLKDSVWTRNTKDSYKGEPYVQVTWLLDFKRFGMKHGYTKNELGLFCRYMLEFSMTCGVPVTLNGETHDYRNIRNFAKLFYPEELVSRGVSQFCLSSSISVPPKWKTLKTDAAKEEFVASSGFIPESQILLLDTPDDGQVYSYANGLMTVDGGVHVEKLAKELFVPIVKKFNKTDGKLKPGDVRPHVTIFLINRLVDTKYKGQSKTILENPTPNITFPDSVIDIMLGKDWNLNERLQNTIGAKDLKGMAKSDGKKSAHVKVKKEWSDANMAGKSASLACSLYIVEGNSAASYPKKRIKDLPGGKDLNGFYPLQGKFMNVSTHSAEKIALYKELINLKKIIGLRQGMDYSIESNFRTLRYGKVVFTSDADVDGNHITGLLINLFHEYWPTLFKRGFVVQLITPVVRVFPKVKSGEIIRFYDENTFMKWFQKNRSYPTDKIKYYKGLGSSKDSDIKDDVPTAPMAIFDHDVEGQRLIKLAFDKTKADERKLWITQWREIRDKIEPLSFSKGSTEFSRTTGNFMGISFPPFLIDNLFRSIPSVSDGLKKSQRQVLYYALLEYNYGAKYNESLEEGDKFADFGGGVMKKAKYHHGEKSLHDTITKMGRDYCSGNNLPILRPFGQFGTRDALGKDASQSRYITVHAPWWHKYLFDSELVDLVPRREVDGKEAEPLWIPADLPLGLINGNQGVATGWSSFIPSHHPIALADWIIARLKKAKRIDPLVPFYQKFGGSIEIKTKTPAEEKAVDSKDSTGLTDSPVSTKSSVTDDSDVDEEYTPEFVKGRGFITRGCFTIEKEYDNKCDILIKEIPVTTSIRKYIEFVQELLENGKIKDYRDMSDEDYVSIELFGISSTMCTMKNLKLEAGLPLTNMVMIDDDGIPKNYESVESILAKYFYNMLELYKKYKLSILGKFDDKISALEMELKIILAYLDDKLVIGKKTTDEELDASLEKLGLDKKIFDKINLRGLSKTKVDILKKKIEEQQKEKKEFAAKKEEKLWSDRLTEFKKQFIKRQVYAKEYEVAVEMSQVKNILIDGELSIKSAHIDFHP
jgi:DNA topoisomerase-2